MSDETTTTEDTEKKKNEPSIESHFAKYLVKSDLYAVELDINGNPILYYWETNGRYWKALSEIELKAKITFYIENFHPGKLTARACAACEAIALQYVYAYGRKLVKTRDFQISTINHILEVQKDGRIRAINKTEEARNIKKYFCRTHIAIDLGNLGEYYTPQDQEKIEQHGKFGKMVTLAMPNLESRRAMQEFFGDTLNPALRKSFPVMIGEPNGGKSQLLLLLLKMHTNSCAINIDKDGGFGYEEIIGKSFVVIDELGDRPSARMIKQLVGGAALPIERKHRGNVTIEPDFKFFAGDNGTFKFSEKTGALEARFYLFKIHTVAKKDRVDEIAKLVIESELKNVFDWALAGAIRVVKRGRILRHDELPAESQALMQNMAQDTNPCEDFIRDLGIVFDRDGLIPKQDVYDQFRQWCEKRGNHNYARVSLPVFVRDFWGRSIANVCPEYESALERRASVNIGMGRKRVECFPVRFTNAPEARMTVIDNSEVKATYNDAKAYNPSNLPPHIAQRIGAELAAMQELAKLTESQVLAFTAQRMKSEGYVQELDGTWSKGDKIDF